MKMVIIFFAELLKKEIRKYIQCLYCIESVSGILQTGSLILYMQVPPLLYIHCIVGPCIPLHVFLSTKRLTKLTFRTSLDIFGNQGLS